MEIKKGLTISSSDFWYDLTDGGYIKPEEILVKKSDIDKVNDAIDVLKDFENSCNEMIEGFEE